MSLSASSTAMVARHDAIIFHRAQRSGECVTSNTTNRIRPKSTFRRVVSNYGTRSYSYPSNSQPSHRTEKNWVRQRTRAHRATTVPPEQARGHTRCHSLLRPPTLRRRLTTSRRQAATRIRPLAGRGSGRQTKKSCKSRKGVLMPKHRPASRHHRHHARAIHTHRHPAQPSIPSPAGCAAAGGAQAPVSHKERH